MSNTLVPGGPAAYFNYNVGLFGRLEDRGLVRSVTEEPQGRTGRPRKYYSLSPEGARELREAYTSIQAMAGGSIPELDRLAEN
jgi:DNA-binding PadR family transcriptional regulator